MTAEFVYIGGLDFSSHREKKMIRILIQFSFEFETIYQRGCVHVSYNFIQQAVWLIINTCYCLLGPTRCCVWNARKRVAATSCIMRGQNLIHVIVQWTVEHASTVHWTVFFFFWKQWSHASAVRWIGFFRFFF
jgi:hypothetical protein